MSEEKKIDENKDVSRRNFLIKAGILTAGFTAAGGILGGLTLPQAEGANAPAIPWSYKALDIEKVRKAGFDAYFQGGCMYGAAKALVGCLQEALPGSEWDTLPVDMFRYGAGGALSWGTLCGALNGALYVMNIAAGSPGVNGIGNDLIGWYTKYPFPSTVLDYYKDPNGKTYPKQVRTVANSPLCHNSVSLWCDASGKTVNSSEKKARCAKLTGDTAARAAQLLNALLVNKSFVAAFKTDTATQDCMSCHISTKDDEQGKMACAPCHGTTEPLKHDHTLFNDNDCGTCHK